MHLQMHSLFFCAGRDQIYSHADDLLSIDLCAWDANNKKAQSKKINEEESNADDEEEENDETIDFIDEITTIWIEIKSIFRIFCSLAISIESKIVYLILRT